MNSDYEYGNQFYNYYDCTGVKSIEYESVSC